MEIQKWLEEINLINQLINYVKNFHVLLQEAKRLDGNPEKGGGEETVSFN